jgi:hypothetical protein
MNTQSNHLKFTVDIVQTKGIFAPKTRTQKAVQWLFKRIKAGVLRYKVTLKKLAKGRVEELGITIEGFPSWCNYYYVVYYVNPGDENQREDALILLFRTYGVAIRNMCVFVSTGPIQIEDPCKRITEVLI